MCTKDRDAVGARWSRAPTGHSSFAGDSCKPRSPPRRRLAAGPRPQAGRRRAAGIVVRVRPRVSKGITDLLARPRSSGSSPALARHAGRSSRSLTR